MDQADALQEEGALPPIFHIEWGRDVVREDLEMVFVDIPWALLDPMELAAYLEPFGRHSSSLETVYDASLDRWLRRRGLKEWWLEQWKFPEYVDYCRQDYAEALLAKGLTRKNGRLPFWVLGFPDFAPRLLGGHVDRMRSLRVAADWEAQVLEDFAEDMCREYGMAVSGPFVGNPDHLEEALVLDLAGEGAARRALLDGLAPGSIWLDALSSVQTRRLVETRPGVTYFSMQKEWERLAAQSGKKSRFALDTALKNGYNTKVN